MTRAIENAHRRAYPQLIYVAYEELGVPPQNHPNCRCSMNFQRIIDVEGRVVDRHEPLMLTGDTPRVNDV